MKQFLSAVLLLITLLSSAQEKTPPPILVNGSPFPAGAFVFFPLTGDSLRLDNPHFYALLRQNAPKRLFYCVYNDEKSRIYDLDTAVPDSINFRIPDPLFYQDLYQRKICPFCHKREEVVPFIYGNLVQP